MCTVSWRVRNCGYDLFFNRDELNVRAPEIAPFIEDASGVRFIAPRDGDHGGTWLLVNEHGVTVCLLNDYANSWRPHPAAARFSRGHIVLGMADVRTPQELLERIAAQPLANAAPFYLLALFPDAEPLLLHWVGGGLACRQGKISPPVLTSSSFATAEVVATRLGRFAEFVQRPEQPQLGELIAFHRQHDAAAAASSVAMNRSDAATRSFIRVSVDRRSVALTYEPACWPRRDCITPVTLNLSRRVDPASAAA
jgi:hypothetical protein